ncbi:hypothetical protein [Sphingomonas sp. PP-CC-3G-468]|uniref:hypothetical protein n=1 Tax=Sphingomonas sp. PP-CC-3G-468 TaxID=2135656 RepID=UPI0010447FFC|nr:hypothetical protein [Sphingomonas sp. PP-CC-3G-468]TCM00247.1 hypothetical protein C8J41_1248 [Sphingomonas sp. PP-CC-3G-468]
MIVDVPTPGEFHTAGVNQLYLAWKITIGVQQALARMGAAADDREAADDYWHSVQPDLANAYSLIQQAMELALKGRIAAVSPFLLLGNPADWPGRGATEPLSFGELPTLDASKLVKVHNLLIAPPLDAAFATFWETVRRDRNRIMHSTSRMTFTAGAVVLAILRAAKSLFADIPWSDRLLAQEAGQKYAIFGMDDHVYSEVVSEIGCAIALLTPADALELLGFDRRRHAYACPQCLANTEYDFAPGLPKLAQFSTKDAGETTLRCTFCEGVSAVDRHDCEYPDCPGNVIRQNLCLTCLRAQDEYFCINTNLAIGLGDEYHFVVGRDENGGSKEFRCHVEHMRDDWIAISYGRSLLEAAHLSSWQTVSILQRLDGTSILVKILHPIGHWVRVRDGLAWNADDVVYDPSTQGPI